MEIDNNLVGKVVQSLLNKNGMYGKTTKLYGTVSTVDDRKCVKLDGSDEYTPIIEGTEVMDGDRVLVGIENHQAVVYANITSPASARTATNFMDFIDDGLVIGELEDDGNEFNILIKADGVYLRNGYGAGSKILVSYKNSGVSFYNGATEIAVFDDDGFILRDVLGNAIAGFSRDEVVLSSDDDDYQMSFIAHSNIGLDGFMLRYKYGNSYKYHKLSKDGLFLNEDLNTPSNDPIGTICNAQNNNSSVVLPSQQWVKDIASLPLSYGTWLVTFGGAFSAVAGGTRQIVLNTNNVNTPSQTRQDILISPGGSYGVRAIHTRIVKVSNTTVLYLHGYTGASVETTVYPFLSAVKIA